MRKNKLFLLLALLLTAATGAWAQTEESESMTTATAGTYTYTGTHFTVTENNTGSADFATGNGVIISKIPAGNGSVTIAALNGENITKVELNYYSTAYYAEYLSSTAGTVSSDGKSITGINASTVTISNSVNAFVRVKSWKIYYTEPTKYTVTMAEGTVDAGNWSIEPKEGLSEGDQVTIQYTGRLKVKGVKATSDEAAEEPAVTWNTVDLSTLTADYEAQDGDVLTGTLGGNYKISIADGATVTLSGAVINGTNDSEWAGLTLAGDGTIILAGENTVKGFYEDYPGIFVPENKTLTIQGDGSLTASSNGYGAGIGGGFRIACGNITIEGGTINAQGGKSAAGIGGGDNTSCGDISITGGTINAQGGDNAAGIGGGGGTSCGNITIANTVTKVTATKGSDTPNSIGAGYQGTCGTVTIGGNVTGNITESPYTYQPSN